MEDVQGKGALITGGASGIGLGMAQAFVEAGMRVVIADLREDHIASALEGFARAGLADRVSALTLDVADREAFAAVADEAWRRLGRVDVLVANAGVGIAGPVLKATYADWDFGLNVNLGGAVNALVSLAPRMTGDGRGGHIVFTASQAGVSPSPRGAAIYATAKAGLVGMAEAIREELAEHGVGVSVLLAGFFRTNIGATESYRPERFRKGSGYGGGAAGRAPPMDSPLWREPIEAGRQTLEGIRRNQLYIATHGELRGWVEGRVQEILESYPPAADPDLARAMGRRRPADPFSIAAHLPAK